MKVLVTGGKGQLARCLLETVPEELQVIVPGEDEFDLTSQGAMEAVIEATWPECIVNTAAYTAVDRAEKEPEQAYAVNAEGAACLAQMCAAREMRLVHVSTDYVFDGNASRAWRPGEETSPLGVYGASKARGELGIQGQLPTATIVRTAWLYSRHGGNFVKTMLRLLAERKELAVVDDQIGAPTWAVNLARVLWHFVLHPAPGIFHCTDAGVASWYDFAVAVAEEGYALDLLEDPARVVPTDTAAFQRLAPRPAFSVLNCRSTYKHTGTVPEHWRAALRRMLKQYAELGE